MDELELLRTHRREQAVANPVGRQATFDRLHWLMEQDRQRHPEPAYGPEVSVRSFGPLSRALLWIAGADLSILSVCPAHERQRHTFTGAALMIATAASTVAAVVAVVAMFRVSPAVAVGCGIAWACGMLTLDRALLVSLTGRRINRLIPLISRLALALVVAMLVSEPVAHWIVSDEVERQVVADRQATVAVQIPRLDIRGHAERAPAMKQPRRYVSGGTDLRGADLSRADLADRRIPAAAERRYLQVERALDRMDRMRESSRGRLLSAQMRTVGLSERSRALSEVRSRNPGTNRMLWTVQILLVVIFVLPVILRALELFSPRTIYDRAVAVRLASSLDPRVVAHLVDHFTDDEGVRLKALDHVAGRVNHAQSALAADAVAEFKLREATAFDGATIEKP